MRTTLAALMLAVAAMACGRPLDDCERRLAKGDTLPAEGCCTHDGYCVRPPEYDLARCEALAAAGECLPHVYPPAFEGSPSWVFCGSDTQRIPCPAE
jgi:hypothetical protein